MSIETLVIRGVKQEQTAHLATDQLEVSESYLVGRLNRGQGSVHTVGVKDDDLVELVFDDDTVWLCNPDTLPEVFPEAPTAQRGGVAALVLPDGIQGAGERGLLGDIGLKIVNVFRKKAVQAVVDDKVKQLAARLEAQQLGPLRGLLSVNPNFTFRAFADKGAGRPYLLFLHGTASSTVGSFGELVGAAEWQQLQVAYGDTIAAFQHETLTKSPLQNVEELIGQLPAACTLHLVSHSRGGLLGELLCRFCNVNEAKRGFDQHERDYLSAAAQGDKEAVEELARVERILALLKEKRIVVRKFVRVACPAAGTLLVSDRLERFFNITLNLIGFGTGLGTNPVYAAFKDLIGAILETKDDPAVLPGLAAMNPASDFIKVLNWPASSIVVDSPLTVIAGNCRIKPSLKALLIIVTKLFYRERNDLVVDTASMFKGAKRSRPVQFYFDETAETDHFHYFQNARTAKLLAQALLADDSDQLIAGFAYVPAGGWRGAERGVLLNLEHGKLMLEAAKVSKRRPIVLMLPGIMGSTLDAGGDELWIDYAGFVFGSLRKKLGIDQAGITATGIISTSYLQLANQLQDTYDVVTFAFDWRQPLEKAAALLDAKIRELLDIGQPIKVVAHSMGGVVMRDLMVYHPDTWRQLNDSVGFRMVMLGAPLLGSFRIPAVLFGRDSIIDKLSAIDITSSKSDLVNVFANFPGILNLLPLTTDADNDFAKRATWEKMRDAAGDRKWPIPSDARLAEFGEYRKKALAAMATLDLRNVTYVAGRDQATASGYRIVGDGGAHQQLLFLYTAEGDQSVTWDSGIPPQLVQAKAVYYTDVSHGSLANDRTLFRGLLDLLARGTTTATGLSQVRPKVRAAPTTTPPVRAEDFDLTPAGVTRTLLGLTEHSVVPTEAAPAPLLVRVSNGDLRYASYPLLAGHFANDGILYAEREIDGHLSGALTERYNLGIYPTDIGTSEVFLPLKTGLPGGDYPGALILGLGEVGNLTAHELTKTVMQGVARYLHALSVRHGGGPVGEANVSSLLIGSNFGGLTMEEAMRAVIMGVLQANTKVRRLLLDRAPAVGEIEFVEVYEDRAVSCYDAVRRMELTDGRLIQVTETKIRRLIGAKTRLVTDSPSGWWNRLSIQLAEPVEAPDRTRTLNFSLTAGRAREENYQLLVNTPLVEGFLRRISTENDWQPEVAQVLFNMLIPYDLREAMQRQGNLNLLLDDTTAEYPWELLQNGLVDARPLSINAGMIRQLSLPEGRPNQPVAGNYALVIGDPPLGGFLPQLPGARQEAEAVDLLLRDAGIDSTYQPDATSQEILLNLYKSRDYKIIHIASHGAFYPDRPKESGVVIGNGEILTPSDIKQLGGAELVFVNCCYLGQVNANAEKVARSRRLAANIGTQLIYNGVKAVVVAGWAVDDAAALTFARTFYTEMLRGCPFGDAVRTARRRVFDEAREQGRRHNTWGAYQCYGDPHYTLRTDPSLAPPPAPSYTVPAQAEADLRNLRNEVEAGRYATPNILARLEAITGAIDQCDVRNSALTECEAFLLMELDEYAKALERFGKLITADQADFTVATLEKYCNVRAKHAARQYLQLRTPAKSDLKKATQEIDKAIKDLDLLLVGISPTSERLSLLGSVYKRKAWVLPVGEAKTDAIQQSADHYRQAAQAESITYDAYAHTNWYVLEVLLKLHMAAHPVKRLYPPLTLDEMRQQLQALKQSTANAASDYWLMSKEAQILLCELLLKMDQGVVPDDWKRLREQYSVLWSKVGSKNKQKADIEHPQFLLATLESVERKRPAKGQETTYPELAAMLRHLDEVKVQLRQFVEYLLALTTSQP